MVKNRSVIYSIYLITISLFLSTAHGWSLVDSTAKKKLLKVTYYKNMFGNVHSNPSRYSMALTTISCGHPVKVYQIIEKDSKPVSLVHDVWRYVKVGHHEGYINKTFLSSKKPNCFQDNYSKFFDHFDLNLTDLYYWGRLYDQYVQGKSKVQ